MSRIANKILCAVLILAQLLNVMSVSVYAERTALSEDVAEKYEKDENVFYEAEAIVEPVDNAFCAMDSLEARLAAPSELKAFNDMVEIASFEEQPVDVTEISPSEEETEDGVGYSFDDTVLALKEGRYANFTDRIEIPSYCRDMLDILKEATDNDGDIDYLIEDKYLATDYKSEDGYINSDRLVFAELWLTPEEYEQKAYRRVYDDYSVSKNALMTCSAFMYDNPQVFYNGRTYSAGYFLVSDKNKTYYIARYYLRLSTIKNTEYDENAIKEILNKSDEIIEEVCSAAKSYDANGDGVFGSKYDKIAYFNKYLTENNGYNTYIAANPSKGSKDLGSHKPWEGWTALYGKSGLEGPVCEGYSKAMKLLCNHEGIECVECISSNHMWNNICINKKWYAVDVTWNDPSAGDVKKSGYESTKYLLVGGDTIVNGSKFNSTHVLSNAILASKGYPSLVNGPELSAEKYDSKTDPEERELTLTVSVDQTELTYGYDKTPKVQAEISDETVEPIYKWFMKKPEGDILISGSTADMPKGLLAGEYYCRVSADTKSEDTPVIAVRPITISVSANDAQIYYGQPLPELSYTFDKSLLVNGDDESALGISISCSATADSKAGSYEIKINAKPDTRKYLVDKTEGTLLIDIYKGALILFSDEMRSAASDEALDYINVYTGKGVKPLVNVVYDGEYLDSKDFKLSYKNNKKANVDSKGNAIASSKKPQIIVKYTGDFKKSHKNIKQDIVYFDIYPRNIKGAELVLVSPIKPVVAGKTVKVIKKVRLTIQEKNIRTLKATKDYSAMLISEDTGKEYDIKDKNLISGKYSLLLKGTGDYEGEYTTKVVLP